MGKKPGMLYKLLRQLISNETVSIYSLKQGHTSQSGLESPDLQDLSAWFVHWQMLGQPWRTEPEIPAERQAELTKKLALEPDIEKGIFPFKDTKLTRADVEWMLAMHEDGRGPVDWSDEQQHHRMGLNLCGADLHQVDLRGLPLACLCRGLHWNNSSIITLEHYDTFGINLEGALLHDVHLEGAHLRGAHLNKASLNGAYLQEANLWDAHLEGAELIAAHLEGTDLTGAHLEGADFRMAHLEGAHLREAHLEDANFFQAHLQGTEFLEAHLERINLCDAHLEQATLRGAHLEGANFWDAHLEGADLRRAHLEGANFRGTHLGGKEVPSDVTQHIQKWNKRFSSRLEAANLQGAYFDRATIFRDTKLGDGKYGFVSLADVRWGDVNLSVIDWFSVKMLGDEREARRQRNDDGKVKDKEILLDLYRTAVRANRQLAIVLQAQGLSEEGARFAYRAQSLQRGVFWRQRQFGQYLFSLFLSVIAGYGYKLWRSFFIYVLVIGGFAAAYYLLGPTVNLSLSPTEAFIFSMTSFHGRGFFPGGNIGLSNPLTVLAAIEAFVGLIIEVSLIATLTQRFFGK